MKKNSQNITKYELIDLINKSGDMLSYVDTSYIYRAANQAYVRYFKKPISEIIDHSVASVIGIELFEKISKPNLDRAFAGEELTYEGWYDIENGEKIYLIVHYYPYINENGDVVGSLVTSTDITDRVKLQEENSFYEKLIIEGSRKAQIGEMIAFIAHQWRGPLHNLNSYLLEMRMNKEKICDDKFTLIDLILENLSENIEDLYSLYNEPISHTLLLNDLIIQAKLLLEYRLFSSNIDMIIKADESCNVIVNNGMMLQMLIVFLDNSIDALDKLHQPYKQITIEARCEADKIIFDIYDNGHGIQYPVPNQIFNAGISTKQSGNHGYGLHFAYKIITEYLYGDVEIMQPINGTWFRITLPFVQP